MPKRTAYAMVAEDDPQWCRFWAAYPKRESKKEARKAWLTLNPSVALVDLILDALVWQVPYHRWAGAKYEFAPLPASWLNKERWADERPPQVGRGATDMNGHIPPCRNWAECNAKALRR